MSEHINSYDFVPDSVKKEFCPRQYFYLMPEFKKTPFFMEYCFGMPCRGDIACNRADCWNMLATRSPYIQSNAVKMTQTPRCPREFFASLSDFAELQGATFKEIFYQNHRDFGTTDFYAHNCPGVLMTNCAAYRQQQISQFETCWSKLVAEIKARKK